MQFIEQNRTEYRIFDSVEDLLASARSANWHFTNRPDFTGRRDLSGWDSVEEASRREWPEGLEVVDRMLTELGAGELPKPKSRRRRLRWDESNGDDICLDRLRSGQSFWRESRRQVTTGPATVTILADVCTPCNVKARDILWRGAAAITLARILEEADYRVELWAYEKCNGRYDSTIGGMNVVCLKRPQDPLDLSTLVSSVSGWFYRSAFFRVPRMSRRRCCPSLGPVATAQLADLDLITSDQKRVIVQRIFDYGAAIQFIKQTLSNMNLVKEASQL